MCRNILLFCIGTLCGSLGTAQNRGVKYDDLKKEYAHFEENDPRALPYISKSIASAKMAADFVHLLHAYEDAAFATPDRINKVKYADSCIQSAQKTQDPALVSMAYLGKGIVYYFNFRKFDLALDQYLLAAKMAEKTNNDYLKFKIKYQIGVVKSYLGYSEDARVYFEQCLQFFQKNSKKELHPHLLYNNTRGYLNTLHQLTICARQLQQYDQAQDLLLRAQPYLDQPAFSQEKGYHSKETGILAFQKKEYPKAMEFLQRADQLLQQKKEDGHLAVTYFYLGSSYLNMKEWEEAYSYFRKVDSLFTRNEAVSAEILKTYELLLKNRNFPLSTEDRNHYIDQLLKADHILQTDLPHLSSRIHLEYDTQNLIAEKEKLLKGHRKLTVVQTLLIALGGSSIFFLISLGLYHRKIRKRYQQLQKKLSLGYPPIAVDDQSDQGRKMSYADEIVNDLLEKLHQFEQTTLFTDPHLTLEKLAKLLDTNKNYLSYVLNEQRKITFYNYRASLRIHYITNLMSSDPQYLKYTIEALAGMCGMASRQQFNKFFHQFNHISPAQYIEQRKKDLALLDHNRKL